MNFPAAVFSLCKKLAHLDWKEFSIMMNYLREDSGRNPLDLFIDMVRCFKKDGVNWLNFGTFGFHKITDPELRKTYLSQGDTDDNLLTFNTRESFETLLDKGRMYEKYRAFLKRDFLDLRLASSEAFLDFLSRHPIVFIKPPSSFGSKGIERIVSNQVSDVEALYRRLVESEKYLVEEEIIQHPEMAKLSINSVNTVRVATCVDPTGNVHIPYMTVRFSLNENYVDNTSVGGAWTLISNFKSITHPAFTNVHRWRYTSSHPVTGFLYIGFEIPFVEEIFALVRDAAKVMPEARYIGWDVAVTPDGPLIIEANFSPSPELFQVYRMMEHNVGLAKRLETALGMPLRAAKRREDALIPYAYE